MANTRLMEKPWLDILPPPPPADDTFWIWLGGSVIVLVITAGLYIFWQNKPKQRALRELRHLQRRLRQTNSGNKQHLYTLNQLLCAGLGMHHLGKLVPPDELATAWHIFYKRLITRQYNKNTPPADDIRQLLDDARHWLKRLAP